MRTHASKSQIINMACTVITRFPIHPIKRTVHRLMYLYCVFCILCILYTCTDKQPVHEFDMHPVVVTRQIHTDAVYENDKYLQ